MFSDNVIGAVVWRCLDKAELAMEFVKFTNCRSVSEMGGACDLEGGIISLTGICAMTCEAKIGGFAIVRQPEAKSSMSNCGISDCRATVRGGALALQKTWKFLLIDNLNITGCSSPVASAIAMGTQNEITFVGISNWNGGFAVGKTGRATSCTFFNSTFGSIKGDVFSAVGCRFKDVGPFEGFVTIHKCEFAEADLININGLDAGGNIFNIDVDAPEERCPTTTRKITPMMISPYAQRRRILQFGIFASAILLLV